MVTDLQSRRSAPRVRTVEDETTTMIVMDFGDYGENLQSDVVDETLIVVDDTSGEQFEFPLPGEHRRTFMQNGILTVEVDA